MVSCPRLRPLRPSAGGPFIVVQRWCCRDSQVWARNQESLHAGGRFRAKACSDSQIHPLKLRITAGPRAFPGKTLQRLLSLGLKSRIEAVASPFCRRNHSPLQQRNLDRQVQAQNQESLQPRSWDSAQHSKQDSAQISAKFLNDFRPNHSKIHKYLQYSQNLTGGRNALENQSEILILLQFIGKHL